MKFLKFGFLIFTLCALTLLPISKTFAQEATLTLSNSEFTVGGTYNLNAILKNTSGSGNLFGLVVILPIDWTINLPANGSGYTGPSGCAWNTDDWLVIINNLLPNSLGFQYTIGPDPGNYQYIAWVLPEEASGIPDIVEDPCNQETFPFSITIPTDEQTGDNTLPWSALWIPEGEGELVTLNGEIPIRLTQAPTVLPQTGYDQPQNNSLWILGIIGSVAVLPPAIYLIRKKKI